MFNDQTSRQQTRAASGWIAAIIGIFSAVPAYGQTGRAACERLFSGQQVISLSAGAASSVFAADLDGDGDADVLSASARDGEIAWYENKGGLGTFGPQQVITTTAGDARSVYAADVDGDGDIDVLSASSSDDKIAWYENTDGLGTFGPQQVITTAASSARSVFAVDLDGDGDVDVLSASSTDRKIAWYENSDGLGTFGPQQIITTAADFASSVYPADLDGDGDSDVLSASFGDHKIAWYENTDGLGTFGPQQLITTAAGFATSVFAADLDGDGHIDVLSASLFDDKIAWYENTDGLGTFGPQQVITTAADGAESVFAADLDGDGDIDVLSASFADDKIAWYENTDGRGAFGPQQIITTAANVAESVFAVDIDGDGDIDVLSASSGDSKIAWYENETDCNGNAVNDGCDLTGGTSADCNGNLRPDECDVADGTSADCNQNGVPDECDLADGTGTDCNENDVPDECDIADGTSADCNDNGVPDKCDVEPEFSIHTITTGSLGADSVFAADLDGDGDIDVLSASFGDDKIAWYENTDGLGTFGTQRVISAAADDARSVFAADMDGDGDIDVVSASFNDDKIAWYENTDGLGMFGPQQIITTIADGTESVFALDMDGDGDIDVLSASLFDDKIAWYENTNGLGIFGSQQVISTAADGAVSVFAADLDRDGDIDVLSASLFDDKIAWYENTDGRGAFGPQQVISLSAGAASSVFAADLDGDGDADVLSASARDGEIAWYENTDGLATFGPQRVITDTAKGAVSVFAADLDGDGDADVLSASSSDDKIAWYENTDGLGTFGPQQVITTSADAAFSVFAADLDGDGDIDVLSASFGDDKIAWYENVQFSRDCNDNGVPDECDVDQDDDDDGRDCNENGVPDECDIADGVSADCNLNGVPDECERDRDDDRDDDADEDSDDDSDHNARGDEDHDSDDDADHDDSEHDSGRHSNHDGHDDTDDFDDDGVFDDCDVCPNSRTEATVIFNGCDTGVTNVAFSDGCTMTDLIFKCLNRARPHKPSAGCLGESARGWLRDGIITGREYRLIVSCAVKSGVDHGPADPSSIRNNARP